MSGFDRRKSETHQKGGTYVHTITIVHMEYGDIRRVVFTCYMYLPLHSTTAMDYKITNNYHIEIPQK